MCEGALSLRLLTTPQPRTVRSGSAAPAVQGACAAAAIAANSRELVPPALPSSFHHLLQSAAAQCCQGTASPERDTRKRAQTTDLHGYCCKPCGLPAGLLLLLTFTASLYRSRQKVMRRWKAFCGSFDA